MMMKSVEFTGRTEEEAITAGLEALGLGRDDVSVEILERHKAGFLGLGSVPAKVRLTYSCVKSKAEETREFITGLLRHMGSDAEVEITETEGGLNAELKGENLGMLIGRRGETLNAIQHLTNDVINRGGGKHVRVTVDAEDYRRKREETLKRLAEKIAVKVQRYRRNVTLEPMNSYERHLIHSVLQDWPDVVTYSIGQDQNRRIVVAYSKDKGVE
ncbi:MAG: RNA-binding cell elongation regulator Jag/EloR [Oscillospiraceae bacterium]|jgi:spoIIIJ-associated protein